MKFPHLAGTALVMSCALAPLAQAQSGIVLDTAQRLQARSIADGVAGPANVIDRMTTGG